MRPLKLAMQAFGPFAAQEVIDFTLFGDNAFLLIHGPTGAGKTSLLDAICYALYGSPSGSTRDERTIRSQHAPDDLLCEVEFLFQIGPRRFSIKRSPEQTLVKKGKEQKAIHRVELCEVDAAGIIVGDRLTKVGEVKERIEQVLGFTADQFRQVVILPQGEFRKLLLASSADKEKILEKLFATERFKQIETTLKERRDNLGKSLEGIRKGSKGYWKGRALRQLPSSPKEKQNCTQRKRRFQLGPLQRENVSVAQRRRFRKDIWLQVSSSDWKRPGLTCFFWSSSGTAWLCWQIVSRKGNEPSL